MTKRDNVQVSITKYKNGWRSRIMIGYSAEEKAIRKEVQQKLDNFKNQLNL